MSEHYIQVAIPVPMRQLFTYRVPTSLCSPAIKVGERVVVPFGPRKVIGLVIDEQAECNFEPNKIKNITGRLNDNFNLSKQLVSFLQLCAHYYHHPVGDVFQQALPVLLRKIENITLSPPMVWQTKTANKEQETSLKKLEKKAAKQFSLYQLINSHHGISWVELRTLGYSKAQLNALQSKDLIIEQEQVVSQFSWQEDTLNQADKLLLSSEQAIIVSAINSSLSSFSCHLVDGVTGSGKTEVYLQAMEGVLAKNQQVLVIVPEIGLTPQTLNRFEQRFNVPIALHHSGLNDKERLATWLSAQQGSAAIVIGTRSAIFTPLHQLGLIIIDEEHDSSLKQQDSFRYHGRDMAILRARQLNIPIVLGTATPSFETLQNALSGKYSYHQLLNRAGKSNKAKIALIDMNHQQVEFGLSGTLKDEMKKTLARGEQVLLFLNRRGYAPAINCQECHWLAECQRCDKPYTLHQKQQLLICHHCGSQKRVPPQCPSCGSVRIAPLGQGTEQLESRLEELFPDSSIVRIDRDSTRKKGELAKLLQEVSDKKHQLLVGTQMLAKGHHFPDVTLVAVLDVDGALFSFDFRASEQMAQLLIQVAGRAGRASKPGKVLVQSNYVDHPLLQDLVHNGYHHFAHQALTERKQALLPPFTFQALLRADSNYPSYPEKFLRALTLRRIEGCEFAGPVPAAMEKKAGKFRFHLIIQAKSRKDLHRAILQLLIQIPNNEWQGKVRWSLDVDPIDLNW
ncbi:primosomal protein N' [Colwellia psychrerythraea]|uniref:Replication restart protein PriA n=1 Tax=Colwellia psychrerythraea TaxID=28229 RepID=A0A099KK12_COLPS|nr:primosomal protein N' [Colwellia psychrerythraea]KGJ91114.1 primosomal protein N [Colwellia psychrerythraea]